jgi:hypothetical protein
MKVLLCSCLLSACVSTSFAAAPQYKARTDIATGFKVLYGMAVADFNGDGKPDIVATDNNAKNLYVYLNDGTGNFGAPKIIPITMSALGPGRIVVGDFNEDGKQDVIVGTVAGLQADILLTGNGDGTFTQQQSLPGSYGFVSGVAVDINNDKHLDLVLGGNGPIFVYLGDGHGGFQEVTFANQGGSGLFTGVTTADFNKDNNLDIVATSPITIAGIRFYPGVGDGTYSSPTIVNSSSFPQPTSLASADFNGDGNPDLLVGAAYISAVIPGNGDGTFNLSKLSYLATPIGSTTSSTYTPLVAAIDIDGDKKVDVVVSDDVSHTINVFLNDGTGEFLQRTPDFSSAIDAGVSQLATADLNGDGIPDLIVASNITQNISVFLSIKPKTTPTASLTSSAASQFVGTSVSLTAKVSGSSGSTPTGTVTLMDGSTSLGQQTLDSSGQAVFSLSNLSAGQHTLTVAYAGDSNFNAVTSSTFSQSITDLQLAFTTASQTISAGGTATYTLTVTPVAGLSGTVTLACSQLPSLATCDPATVTLAGQPATATLTVRTTAPVKSQRSGAHYAFVFLPLIAACCTRRRRALIPLLSISALFALGTFAIGCSSSGNSSSTTTPGTPTGSTTFTVTGTITAGSQTLTRTTTATLIVQ